MDLEYHQQRMNGLFPGLMGVRLLEVRPERVRAELPFRDDLCTIPGRMHGGAIMAFADTLGGLGTSVNLPEGKSTTTIESKTNFLARVAAGSVLVATCEPLHRGRRTMVWQTRLAVDGKEVAIVTQTQMVLD